MKKSTCKRFKSFGWSGPASLLMCCKQKHDSHNVLPPVCSSQTPPLTWIFRTSSCYCECVRPRQSPSDFPESENSYSVTGHYSHADSCQTSLLITEASGPPVFSLPLYTTILFTSHHVTVILQKLQLPTTEKRQGVQKSPVLLGNPSSSRWVLGYRFVHNL